MDDWVKNRWNYVALGGVNCHCCNYLTKKRCKNSNRSNRNILNQLIRARLKSQVSKEIRREIEHLN
jgi:hypothetical protein